ncbi:MAG: alpha/beta fold hydrolase [Pseudomonadales bacterium]
MVVTESPLRFKNKEGRDDFAAQYPFKPHYFHQGVAQMHYVDEGAGEAVVMVHGNPSWSYYYRNLVQGLSNTYRCISMDHIGCGMSEVPCESLYSYTLEQRVNDLEALIDHLQLDSFNLVVHDWGGMIGLAYADRHPEKINRFVILNTAAFPLPASKHFPAPLWLTRTALGEFLVLKFNAFSRVAARVSCKRKKLTDTVMQAYTAPYEMPERRIATLRFVQDIPLRPGDGAYNLVLGIASRLKQFHNTPAIICWGLKDFVFDRHFLNEWQQFWPHADIHRFEDCGHYILEDAFDEILPLIKAHLSIPLSNS